MWHQWREMLRFCFQFYHLLYKCTVHMITEGDSRGLKCICTFFWFIHSTWEFTLISILAEINPKYACAPRCSYSRVRRGKDFEQCERRIWCLIFTVSRIFLIENTNVSCWNVRLFWFDDKRGEKTIITAVSDQEFNKVRAVHLRLNAILFL